MNVRKRLLHVCLSLSGAIALMLAPAAGAAQTLSGGALVTALRQGGFIILMRHASSPQQPPSRENANPDNVKVERQLDDVGRSTAMAMGKALRDLKIPVGEVLSSPTYRALETVRLASFGRAQTFPELGDGGQSMQRIAESPADWLRKRSGEQPRTGTDTVMVTHLPNLMAAFGGAAKGAVDGEALVFRPDGKGAAELLARVKIEEWPAWAKQP